MRFVPVKDIDQQAVLMMHRARNLLVRQRTMAVNALRAHLAEFGVVAPQGLRHVEHLVAAIEENKAGLPELARSILRLIVAQLDDTQAKIRQIEARLAQWHRNNRLSRLLATVPGVGVLGASAIAATVSDCYKSRNKRLTHCGQIRNLLNRRGCYLARATVPKDFRAIVGSENLGPHWDQIESDACKGIRSPSMLAANLAVDKAREAGARALVRDQLQALVERYWAAVRLGLAFHRDLPKLAAKASPRGRIKHSPGLRASPISAAKVITPRSKAARVG